MNVLVTAGPTREYIDTVRFLSNASSGRMGCAVARQARAAGHDVTLMHGPMDESLLRGLTNCTLAAFTNVADLQGELAARFESCDALVMAAAVGDFTVASPSETKLSRRAGPVTLRLEPTDDLLAGLAKRKRPGQTIIAFAVEDPPVSQAEAKAREEMVKKGADFVVVNTPAAMGAEAGQACILSTDGILLPWGQRTKTDLAVEIVRRLRS